MKSKPQTLQARKKYEMCKNFKEKGVCKYGDKCLFAHGEHELYNFDAVTPAVITSEIPLTKTDDEILFTPKKIKDSMKENVEPTINDLLEDLDS